MRKLNLAALTYDRDGIMNALERTNAVEIKEHAEVEGTNALPEVGEELRAYLAALEETLEALEAAALGAPKKDEKKSSAVKDGFSVTYAEFAEAANRKEWADRLVLRVREVTEEKTAAIAEQTALARAIAQAEPYAAAKLPFNGYADTLHTRVRLGTIPLTAWENARIALDELPLVAYDAEKVGESVLIVLTAHKSAYAEAENILMGAGFSLCPYTGNVTGGQQLARLESELERAKLREQEAENALLALTSEIRTLKIYCDYIGFELEKAESVGLMRGTERTFFLEAFVPKDEEEKVKEALGGTSYPLWYEFSDPAKDEEVPTLLKNNPVVSNFEAITNMYSPPSSREFDPNTVMSFFYSLFLGFIMADIGYGILMTLGGGFLWFKNRKKQGGIKNLAGVFAIGGIFTVFWGFLFNSFFGMALLPYKSPMPVAYDLIGGEPLSVYTFVGIQVPALLVIAMIIGIVHLFTGYVCKAVQAWRRGRIFDGICDGLSWAVFSLGMLIAILALVEEFALPGEALMAGGIIAGVSLLLAAVTAGRKEKIVGKFTKGFGALYGIINYLSDILSYARLYGLMLSGAVIAQLVSMYAIKGGAGVTPLIASGAGFAILGVVLLVLGHVFNLAMGLLGAYIHDARLQYVEFYGRFFEGEGELFAPLGSKKKHVFLEEQQRQQPSENRNV